MLFVLIANCKRPLVNFIFLNWPGYLQITVILEYDKATAKRKDMKK